MYDLLSHALVKIYRSGKPLYEAIGGLAETPAPQGAGLLVAFLLAAHGGRNPAVRYTRP